MNRLRSLLGIGIVLITIGCNPGGTTHRVLVNGYVLNAEMKEFEGDIDGAIEEITAAIRLSPRDGNLNYFRGRLWNRKCDFTMALQDFENAVGKNSGSPGVYMDKAYALKGLNRTEEALKDIEHFIGLTQENYHGYGVCSTIKADMGDLDGAMAAAEKCIEMAPDIGYPYFQLGAVYYIQGEYAQALESFDRAIEEQPEAANYWHLFAFLLRMQHEDKDTAQKTLERYLERYPEQEAWYSQLAQWLLEEIDAEALLQHATDQDAITERGKLCEGHFYIASMALYKGDKETARKHFEASVATERYDFYEYRFSKVMLTRL